VLVLLSRWDPACPGKPTDNPFIESFNGRLRQECLNQSWFESVEDARKKIEDWRIDYNKNRPHSSLGNLTPITFFGGLGTTSTSRKTNASFGPKFGGRSTITGLAGR